MVELQKSFTIYRASRFVKESLISFLSNTLVWSSAVTSNSTFPRSALFLSDISTIFPANRKRHAIDHAIGVSVNQEILIFV